MAEYLNMQGNVATKKEQENQTNWMEGMIKKRCRKVPGPIREMLAEMMGTFILIMFGVGSVAQFVLGQGKFGGFLSVNFGWGLGVMFGVYWSAGVSGGHINPAVTLAMVIAGRLPARKLPIYWIGQTLGAFIASALCYGVYKDLLDNHPGGPHTLSTAGIWSTYPSKGVSHAAGFGDQVVGTALLVSTVFALTDKKNSAPKPHILPLAIGLLVVAIGISFGINCGYGINPARDFVPRLFTAIAGWGEDPFTANDHWFWVPILGQLCGGVIGAILYIFSIEMHHPEDKEAILTKHSTNNSDNSEV